MLAAARPLVLGLIAGVLLALVVQRASLVHLPSPGSTVVNAPHVFFDMALPLPLRNSLQIVQHAWRAAAYKNSRFAPSLLHPTTTSQSQPLTQSHKHFSTATATMAANKSFLQAMKDRRTIYQLNKEAPIADKQIVDIVNQIVTHVPSSFNSQSARLVVLLNEDHDKFWEMTKEVLKSMVKEEQWTSGTEPKLNGFKAAYGTVSLTSSLP